MRWWRVGSALIRGVRVRILVYLSLRVSPLFWASGGETDGGWIEGDWDAWRAFLSETSTDVPITNLTTTETTTTTTTRRSTRSIA